MTVSEHPADSTRPVVIVGAGPAGLSAALAAAGAGQPVVVLEKMDRVGARLLATGGGRCNLTTCDEVETLYTRFGRQGRFLGPTMEQMGPAEIRRWMDRLGVPTESPDNRRVYPRRGGASAVRSAMVEQARRQGVEIRTGCRVDEVVIVDGRVTGVRTDRGPIDASAVVLACGGRSYPDLGGSEIGYQLARQAGHDLTPPVPALVGLVTREGWPGRCAGVAMQRVRAWIDLPRRRDRQRTGELLLTHRGLSGPAILDLSGDVAEVLARQPAVPIRIELLPGGGGRGALDGASPQKRWEMQLAGWKDQLPSRALRALLAETLPRSLVEQLLALADIRAEARLAEVREASLSALAGLLAGLPLTVVDTEGWNQAMVTRGGVRLKQVDPHTLASRLVQGLHFAGEMLDLDGPCGGYNLTWAFGSGHLAGTSAAGPAERS